MRYTNLLLTLTLTLRENRLKIGVLQGMGQIRQIFTQKRDI